jgi:dihydrofolate reductase
MRNVVLFMHISLDGFAGGPNGELNWISFDEELQKYAETIVDTVGTAMYGRTTYKMMEGYWPTVLSDPSSRPQEISHARWIENIEKIVFSKTLEKVEWNNTRLIRDNVSEEVLKLKQKPGKDLVIFGSPGLAHSLMKLDLIDQYQLTLNPVLLGQGIPIFENIKSQSKLKLLKTTNLKSGVIGLHYENKR